MRPRTFFLAGLALVVLGLTVVVAIPATAPLARECDPAASPLAVRFGEPDARGGGAWVPLTIENMGSQNERVFVSLYEVDAYRVLWNGGLTPLPSMSVTIDHIEGYEGEDLAPGATFRFGDAQIANHVRGNVRLVAFAAGGCGDAIVKAR